MYNRLEIDIHIFRLHKEGVIHTKKKKNVELVN